MLGSTLVALSASSHAFSENPAGWQWLPANRLGNLISPLAALLLLLIGWVVLFTGWWLIRPRADVRNVGVSWSLTLWSMPHLVAPPTLSPDAFLYADLGWILHQGGNPYQDGLTSLGGPYAASVDSLWAGQGVAYPPLSLLAHWLAVEGAGLHPYWGMVGQRVLALFGVALIAVYLPRLATLVGASPRWASWFGVLNPLLLLLYVGGAHNDALMAGVVVFALWLAAMPHWAVGRRMVAAAVVIGIAMGFKQQAGLAVVGAAGLPMVESLRQATLARRLPMLAVESAKAAAIAVTVFVATSVVSGLGFGWLRWVHVMELAETRRMLLPLPSETLDAIGFAFRALAVAGFVWVATALAHRPMQVVAVGSLLVPFLAAVWHPWYLVLGLVLLGAVPPSALVERVLQGDQRMLESENEPGWDRCENVEAYRSQLS